MQIKVGSRLDFSRFDPGVPTGFFYSLEMGKKIVLAGRDLQRRIFMQRFSVGGICLFVDLIKTYLWD